MKVLSLNRHYSNSLKKKKKVKQKSNGAVTATLFTAATCCNVIYV